MCEKSNLMDDRVKQKLERATFSNSLLDENEKIILSLKEKATIKEVIE